MFPPRPTELLHILLEKLPLSGAKVIDATAGNGHDTTLLAEAVGPEGRVIAVDIQEQAILATRSRLETAKLLERVELHRISHARLDELTAADSVTLIVFNLGYLPGADHTLITEKENTLAALSASIRLLKPGGTLAVTCYPGHPGGDIESEAVEAFLESQQLRLAKYSILPTEKAAPFLLLATTRPTTRPSSHLPHARSLSNSRQRQSP